MYTHTNSSCVSSCLTLLLNSFLVLISQCLVRSHSSIKFSKLKKSPSLCTSNISGNVAEGSLVSNIEFQNIIALMVLGSRMKSSDQMHLVIGAWAHGVRVV